MGDKCYGLVQDEHENRDLKKYFAGNSPTKSGGMKQTSAAKGGIRNQTSKSPVRGFDASPTTGGFSSGLRNASP